MNMRYFHAVGIVIIAALVSGCGHTNHLSKYPVLMGSYYFSSNVRGAAPKAHSSIPSADTNVFARIISSVSEGIASGQMQEKLDRVSGYDLANAVTNGLRDAMTKYLSSREERSLAANPAFLVETSLQSYELHTSANDATVKVDASARIIDRATGAIVWEDGESSTIPLRAAGPMPHVKPLRAAAGYFNAGVILSMSDDEVRAVLMRAAEDAGHMIGETLRQDIVEMSE